MLPPPLWVVVGVLVCVGVGEEDFEGVVGAGDGAAGVLFGAAGVVVGVAWVVTGAACVVTGAAEVPPDVLAVCCCAAGFLAGCLGFALCGLAVVVVAVVVVFDAFVCGVPELPQPARIAAVIAAISARLMCLPPVDSRS